MDWKDRLAQMPPIASVGQTGTEPRQWFRIQAQADTSDEVDVYVYGVIGGWWGGVDAAEFVQQLRGIEAKQVNVHINSVGGNVFDGLAIFQALRNHPARIITYVDALAASAASVIAMAGDRRLVAPYASLMVHKAWALCIGDDDEMHKCGDELARISRNLAKVYSTRATTDTDVDAWLEIMTAETWYSGQEAIDSGLADRFLDSGSGRSVVPPGETWEVGVGYRGKLLIEAEGGDATFVVINDYAPAAS